MERSIRRRAAIHGRVTAPPSKSVTQRALIVAALASGRSRVLNPLLSDDSRYLIEALQKVGIPARLEKAETEEGPAVIVEGRGGVIPTAQAELDVGNAGTAMRFLTAMLACGPGPYLIDGDARMRQRPIGDLLAALRQLGATAEAVHGDGCPPVRVGGGIAGGRARLDGSRSSQYLSAILLAAPAARRDLTIEITGGLVSRPYVDLTIQMMERHGVRVGVRRAAAPGEPEGFDVTGGQRYRAGDLRVEGDYSSASYFFAAAAVTGGRVEVAGVDPKSLQGDARFLDLLEGMGCRVERGGEVGAVAGGELRGIDADLRSMPDVAQTLAVVALFARGESRIRGVPHLRLKETDRIAALVAEIRRLGGDAEPADDGLTIRPRPLRGTAIETHGDHRMAMAFAVVGLAVEGVTIRDAGVVSKSFPAFWEMFDRLTV